MKSTRRQFLTVSLVVLAGAPARLVFAYDAPSGARVESIVELGGAFRNLASVRRVGVIVQPKLPHGDDVERLLEAVRPDRGPAALRRAIRGEHERGETIEVEGWQLARTEARIFALVALAGHEG